MKKKREREKRRLSTKEEACPPDASFIDGSYTLGLYNCKSGCEEPRDFTVTSVSDNTESNACWKSKKKNHKSLFGC